MPRFRLTVAYDGTDFHGWQKQAPTNEDDSDALRTVQGVLERSVRDVVREPIRLLGASRTDAGVHARGQIAAFNSDVEMPPSRLVAAINSRLPHDVLVRSCRIVPDEFNPISDAVSKGYRYRLAHGGRTGVLRPLFDRRITTFTAELLDVARMHEAAARFCGEHDFASFTRAHHGRESTVRTVHECRVTASGRRPPRIHIDVSGNGFLYNMVRIIAGTLVDVGRGRLEPERIPDLIAARDRRVAGPTLPPQGLCLMWIRYSADGGPRLPPGIRP
jgi:tRNA pseudouridine38-40 synthase